jgi:hypothetical protein
MVQNDIFGADCELGAFDSNRPIVTYRLSSDYSNHSVMYNGISWVAITPPRSTNLMLCRPNGYAAWYNGTFIDYTNDGQNWQTIVGITPFPGGIYPDQGGFFDREYFKQAGNIRYHAKFNNYILSKIFTLYSDIGNAPPQNVNIFSEYEVDNSVEKNKQQILFKVVNGTIIIDEDCKIQIFSIDGRKIMHDKSFKGQKISLESGIYIIQMFSEGKYLNIQKVILTQ